MKIHMCLCYPVQTDHMMDYFTITKPCRIFNSRFFLSSSNSSFSSTTVRCGFQNVLPPFRTVSDYCLLVSHSHYVYILFKILHPSFSLALFYFLLSLLLLRFVAAFVGFTWFSKLKNLKTCTPHVTFEILTELKLNFSVS